MWPRKTLASPEPESSSDSPFDLESHLSRIVSQASLLLQATGRSIPDSQAVQRQVWERFFRRYQLASYRFLMALTRDSDFATEIFQRFAEKFVQGGLAGFDPAKGRFRDYLKEVLRNDVKKHQSQRQRNGQLTIDSAVEDNLAADDADSAFNQEMARQLIQQVLRRMEEEERTGTHANYSLISALLAAAIDEDVETDQPHKNAPTPAGDKSLSPEAQRKRKQRAKEMFGDYLVDAIGECVESIDLIEIEEAAVAWGLHPYCKSALKRRRKPR